MSQNEGLKCEVPLSPMDVPKEVRGDRPIMIWDGECGFCARWIKRWERITGDKIQYVQYQFLATQKINPEQSRVPAGARRRASAEQIRPELTAEGPSRKSRTGQPKEVLKGFPQVSVENCKRAVQLVVPDGSHYQAAEAVFRSLDYAGKQKCWLWLYRYFPGFKSAAEFAYRFIAGHRRRF